MKTNKSAPENTAPPTVVTNPLPVAEGEAIILLREIADTLAAIRELDGEQLTYLMKINRRMP